MSVATFCKKKYPWRKIGCNRNIPWVLRGEKLDGRKITDFHKLIGKMRSRKVRVNSYHCACALLLTLELKPFWSWIYILIIKNVQCVMSMTSWLIHTLPFKMFGPFWSVWCKMALAEVGVSLPWWCHTLVLLAPGYWRLFLNLIIFS